MDRLDVIFWLSILIFNLASIKLLQGTLPKIDIKAALQEKAVVPANAADPPADNTSYSRLSGLVGSIVIACFFWGLGNLVLYKAAYDLTNLQTLIEGTIKYLLGGASLFIPYGANQLSKLFK